VPSSSRRASGSERAFPDRPEGPLLWAHAADPDRIPALIQIAERAAAQRPGLSMLLTQSPGAPCPDRIASCVLLQTVPDETSADCRTFLAHWRPDICIWHTGHLRPTLLSTARQDRIPMILVDAAENALQDSRMPWARRSERAALLGFQKIFAQSANTGRRLARMGVPPDQISVTGSLQEGGAALGYNESDHEHLSEVLVTRPVWLAAMIQPDEFPIVAEAHRQAIRAAHRLMMILVPDRPEHGDGMVASLDDQGLRYVRWSEGGVPGETTQVLVADTHGEMGLWYRLAPVTFMGSSLTAGHGGRDPYEPAALGSAILYGPNVSHHAGAYARFSRAGAARPVRDAATLSAGVLRLNAPDQAAAMAQAAWEVATEGAEVTDKVLETVEEILDRRPRSGRTPSDARA
jgi:3-deoxy-D-manno-octulosonic-acid transferase